MTGEFNRVIKVKEVTTVTTTTGGTRNTGVQVLFKAFAKVTPLSSNYLLLQGLQTLQNAYTIEIRWAASRPVVQSNVIEYEGEDLKIISISESTEGSKRFLIIKAQGKSQHG